MLEQFRWKLRYGATKLVKAAPQSGKQLAAWRRFWRRYRQYQGLAAPAHRADLRWLQPCLGDDTAVTQIEPIYFYQDTWAFERIIAQRPAEHVDVGSHHKFVALLSKVIPVTMVDIRPLSLPLDGLKFRQGSILELPYADGSLPSVSSLCVVEHIGLGRYGDKLDPMGSEKALAELKRVLQPGGDLYLSLPVDDENRTYFDAHRSFSEQYIEELVTPFEILDRKYIFGSEFLAAPRDGFGIGCYHLRRPTTAVTA